jgi:hypothetical protein
MRNIRKDTISGVIDDIGRTQTTIQFNEWWGKEGMDFVLYTPMGDETKNLSLSRDELHALVVASICSGYVDGPAAIEDAKAMIEESKEKMIDDANKLHMRNAPNSMTMQGDLNVLMEE